MLFSAVYAAWVKGIQEKQTDEHNILWYDLIVELLLAVILFLKY